MPKVKRKQMCRSLMTAVAKESFSETKRLLSLGKHPDSEKNSVSGQTPAFLAASHGHHDIFKLLLSKGADVGIKDINGNSILHVTTNTSIIEALVGAGLDVNGKNKLGRTPLHCAIIRGGYEAAQGFIKNGGDVNDQDSDGNTSLHHLSKSNHIHNLIVLQYAHGDFDITDAYDSNKLVPFLKRYPIGGFHRAILEHEQDLFEHICRVASFAKSQHQGTYTMLDDLDRASNKVHTAEVLVRLGANPNIPNIFGQLPLHLAVDGTNKDLITFLCKSAPLTVNAKDNMGRTPAVHCFSFLDHYDQDEQCEEERKKMVLQILLEHGADLNTRDVNGIGLLCYAADSLELFKFVTNLGVDVNIRDSTESSILHILAGGGDPDEEMVELLLQKGLDINCRDQFGATALFFATWAREMEWINLLVKHGCRIDALDHAGRTAAELADFNKRDDIGDILREMARQQTDPIAMPKALSDGEDKGNADPEETESDSDREPSKAPGALSTNTVLAIENRGQVESMFKSVTLPVDGSHYIADLLESPVTGRSFRDEENRQIKEAVLHVISKISEQCEKFDPRFKMRMELSGSVNEGTKCGPADEFDFLCCLESFEDKFQPEEGESDPPGFVGIVGSENSEDFKEWQKKDGSLINSKIVETFYRILYKALHSAEVWETTKALFPSLNYIPELLLQGPSVALSLNWTGAKFKNMEISIDMVPAIYFKNWWPRAANDHLEGFRCIHADGCHVVLTTFQDMDSWDGDTPFGMRKPHYFRISFSKAEAKFFQSVSQYIRDGFILAKALREQCQPVMSVYSLVQELERNKSSEDFANKAVRGCHSRQGNTMSESTANYEVDAEDEEVAPSSLTESEETMSNDSSVTSVDERNVIHADIIDTYMLKMSLIHEFNMQCGLDDIGNQNPVGEGAEESNTKKAFEWVKRIYNRLRILLEQGSIPSFFVPGFDLLNRKDTKDFYVFDDKFTEEELDAGNAVKDSTIIYNPLPEQHQRDKPKDGLPNDIDILRSLLTTAPGLQKSFIWSKLRKLCDRENIHIYVSIIDRILRECKENTAYACESI